MALGTEFPVITTGNLYTAIDTYASTITTQPPTNVPSNPNGAQNPAGSFYLLAPGSFEGPSVSYAGKGWGAPLGVRYVRYNSTTNPALVAFPAPVYWTDETFTVVSGAPADAFISGTPQASLAGWMFVNTASVSGLTNTTLNGNWVFIATIGWLPNAAAAGATAGQLLVGATSGTNFTPVATGSATTFPFARAITAAASSVADIVIDTDPTF